jgi:hypothetical protein
MNTGDAQKYYPQEQPREGYQPTRKYPEDSDRLIYQPDYQAPSEPLARYGPGPKQAPTVDHAEWWEQQRQIVIGRRKAERDTNVPQGDDTQQSTGPDYHFDIGQLNPDSDNSDHQTPDSASGNDEDDNSSPRYDVPKEQDDGIVEVWGRRCV